MKDLIIKIFIILFIAIIESTVGLPVLTFILYLMWLKKELNLFLIWIILISLFISVLWGATWWLSLLILLALRVAYEYFGKSISNKLLRVVSAISPVILFFAVISEINFHWRIVLYGFISFMVLFVLQKFLLNTYENKYL